MTTLRWPLSTDPLRDSAMTAQCLALVGVIACGAAAHDMGLPVSPWYAFKAGAVCAAVMWIALPRLHTHLPHLSFGPANQVTTLRSALVALTAALIGEESGPAALYAVLTAVTAVALDGVDGWLARRTRMSSRFGARFDMEVDALLIQVLAVLAWQYGKAGAWVVTSGLLRYLFVAAGLLSPRMRRPLFPSVRRQAVCVVQIVGLILALIPAIVPPLSNAVAAIALAALCWSFVVDAVWLWRQ